MKHGTTYGDLLTWTLESYHAIITKVQPNTDDLEARKETMNRIDKSLTALHKKWL